MRAASLAVESQSRRFIVHGRVQGVWFRDSTRSEAKRLEISGHAVNLPDGNVEVLASGSPEALHELEQWLQTGPPLAAVTKVESERVAVVADAGFRIA